MNNQEFHGLTDLLHTYSAEHPIDPHEVSRLLFLGKKGVPLCFFIQDSSLRYTWVHDADSCFASQSVVGKTESDLFSPEDAEALSSFKRGVLDAEEGDTALISLTTEGKRRSFRIAAESYKVTQGKPLGLAGIMVDRTTEQDALDAQKENYERILAELLHRIKNNLAVLTAIIYLQQSQSKNPEAKKALSALHGRVQAISTIYTILNETKESGEIEVREFLRRLTSAVHSAYGRGEEITLTLDIEPLTLSAKEADAIGLLVNELLTNAYKHAFPPGTHGEVSCSLRRLGGGGSGVELLVQDSGAGCPPSIEKNSSTGLGFRLIRELTEEIGGTLRIENTPGACFTVVFIPSNG